MEGEGTSAGVKQVSAVTRLQARGQFTVPEAVRKATGAKPGDTLLVRAVGDRRFEVIVVPRHSPDDFFRAMALRDDLSLEELRQGVAESIAWRVTPEDALEGRHEAAATRDPGASI